MIACVLTEKLSSCKDVQPKTLIPLRLERGDIGKKNDQMSFFFGRQHQHSLLLIELPFCALFDKRFNILL